MLKMFLLPLLNDDFFKFQKSLTGVFSSRNAHSVEQADFTFDPSTTYLLDEEPATQTTLTREDALSYYKDMVTIRRMETAAANLYKEKAIRGFCHLCSGQEAIYIGMKAAMRSQVNNRQFETLDFWKMILNARYALYFRIP